MPMTRPLFCGGNIEVNMAMPVVVNMAAEAPWITRAEMSISIDPENPAKTADRVNRARPQANMRFRPYRSAILPTGTSVTAVANKREVAIQLS
jgi:hypothetical protein